MNKKISDNDKGYSLVEMIIVLAIVGVISAMAMVTVTMIYSAKAKSAAIQFDNEVSTLISKSKSLAKDPEGYFSIKLEVRDGKYFVVYGHAVKSGTSYTFTEDTSIEPRSLSPYAVIKFSPETDTGYGTEADADGTVLVFSKDGLCLSGAGKYSFYKRNGNNIANDYVRKNGSHQSK